MAQEINDCGRLAPSLKTSSAVRTIAVDGPWTLSFTHPETGKRKTMKATVPGNVEIDLQREGLMGNPFPPDDSYAARDWERVDDWLYETVFDAPSVSGGEQVDLVFEGIDTIAEVYLNDALLLNADNMFIPHSARVGHLLRLRDNRLSVRIRSPELYARRFAYDAFQYARGDAVQYQGQAYLRKARHMWGWDNAPHLLSAGLWRPVSLVVRPSVRLQEVYLYTQTINEKAVTLGCNWTIATEDLDLGAYRGVLQLSLNGKTVHVQDFPVPFTHGRFVLTLPREKLELWWPRGYGDPVLYDAEVSLWVDGKEADSYASRLGIRIIELLRSDVTTAEGEGEFLFRCNGELVYIRGANWKPKHALHSLAPQRVRPALDLVLGLHCNMIRVWGGGIYEEHGFFDYCDGHGIMVWQDFMFACEFPPRDQWYLDAVAREAAWAVREFRNHPSLALWSGDNEVDQMFFKPGRMARELRPSHNIISRRVLKDAVLAHNPHTPYLESSPYASDRIIDELQRYPGRKPTLFPPEDHVYPLEVDFNAAYRACPSHFVSETGPFFINSMSESESIVQLELKRAKRLWNTPWADPSFSNDMSRVGHQSDRYFLTWKHALDLRLDWLFGRAFTIEDWRELALGVNIFCGNNFKFAIEYSRSRKWKKSGVIWWSLSDMFPMMFNYSVVDYEWRRKKPYYWIRQSQQPVCLMVVDAEDGALELFIANDTLKDAAGTYRISRVDEAGNEREVLADRFASPRNESLKLTTLPAVSGRFLFILRWKAEGESDERVNHYVAGPRPFDFPAYKRWVALLDTLYGVEG